MKIKFIKEDFSGDVNQQDYTTDQAKTLDELTYLLSTEYEAVKWYDESISKIQTSGLDQKVIAEIVQGIKEIRKDEEDHVRHLEELVELAKGTKPEGEKVETEPVTESLKESISQSELKDLQNQINELQNTLFTMSDNVWADLVDFPDKDGKEWKVLNKVASYINKASDLLYSLED